MSRRHLINSSDVFVIKGFTVQCTMLSFNTKEQIDVNISVYWSLKMFKVKTKPLLLWQVLTWNIDTCNFKGRINWLIVVIIILQSLKIKSIYNKKNISRCMQSVTENSEDDFLTIRVFDVIIKQIILLDTY